MAKHRGHFEWLEIKKKFMNGGPDRVVINQAGEAVPQHIAKRDYGMESSIVFVRDDGWTLGAPTGFHDVAEGMWLDKWVAVFVPGIWKPVVYEQWKRGV